jgi:hypothetical protein
MADKKSERDDQNASTAASIRAAVSGLRGGINQRDAEVIIQQIEGIARGLEEQEKTPEQLEELRLERGEPDPNKTAAELVKETFEADLKAEGKKAKDQTLSSPAMDPNSKRLGIPVVTSQPTTGQRDKVETAAKKADEDIKAAAKK